MRVLLQVLVNISRLHCEQLVGTVDNHGNMEITETVIFVKCRECRDYAKMPCFLPKCRSFMFLQEYF